MSIVGCKERMDIDYKINKDMKNIDYEIIDALKDKRIYFGHASIGYNIFDGIENIIANNKFRNINIWN